MGTRRDTPSISGVRCHVVASWCCGNESIGAVAPSASFNDYMVRWKSHLNSFGIPWHLYLTHIVDWAREVGYSNDHKLIADCKDFLDLRPRYVLIN